MIKVIKSNERHHRDLGWLSTYWHFSFDDYHDPTNMNWGALRVFNDGVVEGKVRCDSVIADSGGGHWQQENGYEDTSVGDEWPRRFGHRPWMHGDV